jgi:antitoxin (DNA-binding transcriptional repressor) of toxin-antitoxin stability system
MTQISLADFRTQSKKILARLAKGRSLLLAHRGKMVARLEPLATTRPSAKVDPFLTICVRAKPSPLGPTSHAQLNQILYGTAPGFSR